LAGNFEFYFEPIGILDLDHVTEPNNIKSSTPSKGSMVLIGSKQNIFFFQFKIAVTHLLIGIGSLSWGSGGRSMAFAPPSS